MDDPENSSSDVSTGDKKHLDPLTEPQTTEDTQQSSSADGTDPQAADSETQRSSQGDSQDSGQKTKGILKSLFSWLLPKSSRHVNRSDDAQEAADSETQRSSQGDSQNSGQKSSQFSNSDEEKPSQEDLKVSQLSPSPPQSDTTEAKIPANMKPEELTARLQELQGLIPEDCMKAAERLVKDYDTKIPGDSEHLSQFFTCLKDFMESNQKSDKGMDDPENSSSDVSTGDKKHLDPLTEPQTTEDTQQSSSADGTDPQAADSETQRSSQGDSQDSGQKTKGILKSLFSWLLPKSSRHVNRSDDAQEAADSETQRSSQGDSQNSGQKSSQFSNSDEEKPSQEDLKVSQLSPSPPQSDTTEAKIPANMKPEELTARLQELQGLIPEDCMKAAERLVKDYDTKIPGDSEHLSQFFTCLKDFMESNQKSDKGDKKHLDPLTEPQTTEDTQQSSSADGTDPQAADSETQRSSQGDSQDSGQKTKGILKSLFSWLLPKSSRHVNRSDDAQEAADSETQRSSQGDSQNSGQKSSQFSNSDEEKPSQEDLKVSQLSPSPPQSDTTEAKIPANMKPEELTARLQELQGLIPEDCMKAAERLVKDYDTKIPGDSEHLSQFFTCLKDFMESNQKSDKGKKHKRTHLEKSGKPNQQVKNRALWYPVTVKVFCEVTGQTFGAHETILQQVKKKGLTSTQVKITTDLQKCDVIIVFCPIVSRAGSDVKAATRNISGSKPIILVLMHHTRKPDHSTGGKMWSETFPGIVLEVNVLYHETESGLLTCSENDKAIKKNTKRAEETPGVETLTFR
ncbi:apoptotic chromatin condensation inducer in the nucleus isoform X18 [Lates calcarifer]|uniref:Apoptotic chromatin condensation inducer in the nucleus isoform X16 n=1 Tax=Lates calcarifer TaxID=8187 RepID=A0AAJ8B036_LATCA|nr:apoptotic chromatin condensation inducer in the nucleus isoform X16 [Lates calcarifer]XP_050923255.1 apoptotic chromatin condensation inducer in the nucleus isoform X17 [Lates calcarifer]XP_050923256.1 apoptotic chromatin condensation inducer in the nucleus isoform X18 [Lates calcarifer]